MTPDSVEINFDISNTSNFDFVPGQYITIKHEINGEDIRRAYSICSAPSEGLSIGVKRVEGGKMSTFLVNRLNIGDTLEVMPPQVTLFIMKLKNMLLLYVLVVVLLLFFL